MYLSGSEYVKKTKTSLFSRHESKNIIDKYRELDHINVSFTHGPYILSHHPVFKSCSRTIKEQVIFNELAPARFRICLIELLMAEPKFNNHYLAY